MMDIMENPWKRIKKTDTEYIAPCDRACIQCYQEKVQNTYQLHLALVPGPYSGDPEQAVV
jgi:hypothetical protein